MGRSHSFSDRPLTMVNKNTNFKARPPAAPAMGPLTGFSSSLSLTFLTYKMMGRVAPYEC